MRIGSSRKLTRSSLLDFVSRPQSILSRKDAGHVWALKNISVEIKRGACVALMGPNGAGKSTFLKILSRISEPSEGSVDVWGSVGSLLETGIGFHPELSGRENIYLCGAILGLRQSAVKASFDEIVDFSGVEQFIDEPVRIYSSGMKARLGFSVMAIQPHDTLLLDEVLTVGDLNFRQKCKNKIKQLKREGRTLVVVSHSVNTTNEICDSALYISGGQLVDQGKLSDVLPVYMRDVFARSECTLSRRINGTDESACKISDVKVVKPITQSGEPIAFEVHCSADNLKVASSQTNRSVRVSVRLIDEEDNVVVSGMSYNLLKLTNDNASAVIHLPSLRLAPGVYSAQIALYEERDGVQVELDRVSIKPGFPILADPNAPRWLQNIEMRGVVVDNIEVEEVARHD